MVESVNMNLTLNYNNVIILSEMAMTMTVN